MVRFTRWFTLLVVALLLGFNLPGAHAAPSAQTAGQICVLAFLDGNGDGEPSLPDEALLPGVTFILSNDTGRLSTYTTDGSSEPYCFGNLAVGQYTVQARPDAKKIKGEATTPGQWVVPLSSGAQYDITYGVQEGAASTNTANANSSKTASSGSSDKTPLGRLAAGLLGAAMFGGAGYLAYTIIRRARRA